MAVGPEQTVAGWAASKVVASQAVEMAASKAASQAAATWVAVKAAPLAMAPMVVRSVEQKVA